MLTPRDYPECSFPPTHAQVADAKKELESAIGEAARKRKEIEAGDVKKAVPKRSVDQNGIAGQSGTGKPQSPD